MLTALIAMKWGSWTATVQTYSEYLHTCTYVYIWSFNQASQWYMEISQRNMNSLAGAHIHCNTKDTHSNAGTNIHRDLSPLKDFWRCLSNTYLTGINIQWTVVVIAPIVLHRTSTECSWTLRNEEVNCYLQSINQMIWCCPDHTYICIDTITGDILIRPVNDSST